MPTVRVFLTCATPTKRPGGLFDTFITLSEAAYEGGEHLEIAKWRAGVVGHAGPYRVTEVRRLDLALPSGDEIRARLTELADRRLQRWLNLVDQEAHSETSTPVGAPPLHAARSRRSSRSRT